MCVFVFVKSFFVRYAEQRGEPFLVFLDGATLASLHHDSETFAARRDVGKGYIWEVWCPHHTISGFVLRLFWEVSCPQDTISVACWLLRAALACWLLLTLVR